MRLHLEAIKGRRIVARGNHDTTGKVPPPDFKGNIWRRINPIHHDDAETVPGKHFRRSSRERLRLEPSVEANENRALFTLNGIEVSRRSLRGVLDVLKRKGIGNDSAPPVGAEFDR
jgi:hypothetical protein